MKNSNLFLGIGIGLLVGAAVAAYLVTSDEDKQELMDEINATVKKAKKSIGRVVDEGMEELDKAADKVSQVAHDAVSKVKGQL